VGGPVDSFEHVFDDGQMGGTVSVLRQPADERLAARPRRAPADPSERGVRTLDTVPALADLLPGGALRTGATYSITGSTALTMALLAGPSAAGAWCGVVGLPGFAAAAGADLGIDLGRLVFVPDPGPRWLSVVGALIDALTVVVVRPPTAVGDAEAARIAARLRQREAVLLSCGLWPRSEAQLTVTESAWLGVGSGHGHLTARQTTVVAKGRGTAGRPRHTRLWLPDPDGTVRVAEETVTAAPADATPTVAATANTGTTPAWIQEAVG
jgi:hypothetical protein